MTLRTLLGWAPTPTADVVRRLNRWADGAYTFRQCPASIALDVDSHNSPHWPFVVSVKPGRGPALAYMLENVGAGRSWPWWQELETSFGVSRPWLIWRDETQHWLLSLSSLGMLDMPPRLSILPLPIGAGWPRFTLLLDRFLGAAPVGKVAAAIADGWGT